MRDVLDEESDSEVDSPDPSQASDSSAAKPTFFNFVLCGPDSFMMAPDAIKQPPQHTINILLTSYFHNVDPIFKVIHTPTIREYLQEDKPYLGRPKEDPAATALAFAIYYSAIITIDEETCRTQLGEEKATLRKKYRFAVEALLAQADFISSQDIVTLQAFVIMLVSIYEVLHTWVANGLSSLPRGQTIIVAGLGLCLHWLFGSRMLLASKKRVIHIPYDPSKSR